MKGLKSFALWMIWALVFASAQVWAQTGGTVTYVYTDPQGTPLAETDANGNITATFEYTPYGTYAPQGTSSPGPAPKGPGYTGHVNDPETNLVYMQARYYDPATGRFLSIDPVAPRAGDTSSFDRFAYGNDNPVTNTDPDGRESASLTLQGLAGIEAYQQEHPLPQDIAVGSIALEAGILLGPLASETLGIVRTAAELNTVRNKAAILEANKIQGKMGEAVVREELGDRIAGEQVSFKSSDGTRSRLDFVTKEKDVIDAKTGDAKLSPGQAKLKADIDAGRAVTPVGKNAAKAGLQPGRPTVMRSCGVYRC